MEVLEKTRNPYFRCFKLHMNRRLKGTILLSNLIIKCYIAQIVNHLAIGEQTLFAKTNKVEHAKVIKDPLSSNADKRDCDIERNQTSPSKLRAMQNS